MRVAALVPIVVAFNLLVAADAPVHEARELLVAARAVAASSALARSKSGPDAKKSRPQSPQWASSDSDKVDIGRDADAVRRGVKQAAAELSHHPQNLRYEVGLHDQHIGDAVHGDNRVANGSASRLYASQRTKMRAVIVYSATRSHRR